MVAQIGCLIKVRTNRINRFPAGDCFLVDWLFLAILIVSVELQLIFALTERRQQERRRKGQNFLVLLEITLHPENCFLCSMLLKELLMASSSLYFFFCSQELQTLKKDSEPVTLPSEQSNMPSFLGNLHPR